MIIAKAEPTTHCQTGTLELRFSPSRSPVTTALKSPTVCFLWVARSNSGFGNGSTDDAGGDDLKRAGAEDHDGGDGGREQRDDDIEHHAAAGIRGMNMRGVRYDQLIHITFPLLFRPERPCIF